MTYDVDPIFGCHLAHGPTDKDGYIHYGGGIRAHVVAWEIVHGRVPSGFELDHLCRRRNCCAPHHLEAVNRAEQERRKSWRYRAKRTKCDKGHDLRTNGIVTPEGGRVCRQCNRDANPTDLLASQTTGVVTPR